MLEFPKRGEPDTNDEIPKFSHDKESWGASMLTGEERLDAGVSGDAGAAKATDGVGTP